MFQPSFSLQSGDSTLENLSIIQARKEKLLEISRLTFTNLIVESVETNEFVKNKLKSVKCLDFVYQNECTFDLKFEVMHTIDCLLKILPSVQSLTVNLSGFKNVALTANYFARFACLENLIMIDNELKKIDPNTFSGSKSLKCLALRGSGLKSMLNHLNLVDMSGLVKLDLSRNQLSVMKRSKFEAMADLRELSLSQNEIETVEFLSPSLASLTVLRLNENKICLLSVNWFKGLTNLQCLDLSGNKIEKLEARVFSDLVNLTSLDLSKNEINKVGVDAFAGLVQLGYLNLSENKILVIESSVFSDLKCLVRVDLSRNEAANSFEFRPVKSNGLTRIEI